MTGIVVMADYHADPVCAADPDGRPGPMITLDGLSISEDLKAALRGWAAEFDGLAETDYEWSDDDHEQTWIRAGRGLAERLGRELGPRFRVHYRG